MRAVNNCFVYNCKDMVFMFYKERNIHFFENYCLYNFMKLNITLQLSFYSKYLLI